MKKTLLGLFLVAFSHCYAQTYLAPTTGILSSYEGACPIGTCSGTYYDNGGAAGNYALNINSIYQTICPTTPGNAISMTFTSFNTEAGFDYLQIGNGPAQNSTFFTTAPANASGQIMGTPTVPFTYVATNSSGCLTLRFRSDNVVTASGWAANISCVPSGTIGVYGNSDCANSTFLCSNLAINDQSYGPGINPTESCNGSCIGGEVYSNWYTFSILTSGTLGITIAPNTAADDYDFSVFGPNTACGSATPPIRCSFSGVTGNTGLGNGAVDLSEGVAGNGWVAPLNAIAGETYSILVNKWSPAGTGFNLNFTGTATLGNLPPTVTPQTICAGLSATLTATPFKPGGTYLWSNGATTQSITVSPLATTTYSVVYTLNGCASTPTSVAVTVNPNASIALTSTAPTTNQTLCITNAITNISYSIGGGGTGATFTGLPTGVSGTYAGGVVTISGTPTVSGTFNYTVNTTGTCAQTSASGTITINPKPTMTSTNSATICSGGTVNIPLTSSAPATYSWIASDNGNTTGESTVAQSSNTLNNTITNNSTVAQSVSYTVTPTGTAGSCLGTPQTVTVIVNPVPVMSSANTATICSGGTVSIPLTSAVTSSYTWIATDNLSTNGESTTSQSTSTLSNTITNNTGLAQTVTYTVTPTASSGGCVGAAQTVTVTINPVPAMTNANTATICSGGTLSIPLTSTATATYAWLASDNPNITGESITTQSANPLSNTLTNITGAVQTVSYTVTPTATIGGCVGATQTITVTVNPKPSMTSANTATICSGSTVSIPLTSSTTSNYSWIATDNTNTTGESTTAQSTSTISNTITNNTGIVQTVTYTVTPTATSGGCVGLPQTITVTVNPKPAMTSTNAVTICSGGTVNIPLTSSAASAYTWIAADNVNTTGESTTLQLTSTLNNTLTNTSGVVQTISYTVTPTATTGGCVGSAQIVTVTLNPKDNASFTYASSTYCQTGINPTPTITGLAGGTFTSLPSGLVITAGTGLINLAGSTLGTYSVTYTTNGPCPNTSSVNITVTSAPTAGFSYSGSPYCQYGTNPTPSFSIGASAGTFTASPAGLVFVNTNTGQINLTASAPNIYTITNSIAAGGGCAAATATFSITINPTPIVTATPNVQTLCSGATTSIALSSSIGATTYTWTVVQTGLTGASSGNISNIAQSLTTTGTTSGTAVYTVTPITGTCPGSPISVTVNVNPVPNVIATPVNQTLCSGTTTSIALTSNVGGTTFSWTDTQTGAAGASSSSGSSISQTLLATGITAGTVNYTITPSASGCPGTPLSVPVTVNPVPFVTATPTSQTICSGGTTAIALSSFISGTNFAWTVSQSGVSGATPNSGSSISQTLTTVGSIAGSANYTITPTAAGCPGNSVIVPITVNPTPDVTATPTFQTICSGTAMNVNLTSSVTGTTFSWGAPSQIGTTGGLLGSGNSINQTLSTTGNTQGTVIYSITPSANSCNGLPINDTVKVNPNPTTIATPSSQTICSGATTAIALSSAVAGSTFTWSISETGVTGAANGAGNSIAQTLSATGSSSGNVSYTILPLANGCLGLPITVSITVNPIPTITATPLSQTICSGNAISVALTSDVTGATFAWSSNQSSASGANNGSGFLITDVLNATGVLSGSVAYTITPSASGCIGTPIVANVAVNPNPVLTVTPTIQTFCDGGTTSISLNSDVAGTAISWTVNQVGVSGGSNSTGSNIADALSVTGSSQGTATYTITSLAAGCAGLPVTSTVTVNPIDNASFTYPSSTYCQSGIDPTATITGLTGGTFSANAVGVVFSNTSTGLIDLSASSNGSYSITYLTNGVCPTTSSIILTITNSPTASFTYMSPFCSSDLNPIPSFIGAASAGLFSAHPTGLIFVSSNTGEIDLVNSISGTYTIVNTITAAGGCAAAIDSATVNINPAPTVNAGIDGSVCEAGTYSLSGTIGGGASSATWTTSGTGTFIPNANTLIAQYSPSSVDVTSGTVTLTLTTDDPAGVCSAVDDYLVLSINPLDSAVFSYTSATFCQSGTNPTPTITGLSGGTFTSTSGLVFVSNTTGEINLNSSTLGTYTITYTTNGVCPNSSSGSITITNAPIATFNYSANATSFCQTDPNPTPLFGAGASAGTFTSNPTGLVFVSASTGQINLLNSIVGSYTITNTIVAAGGCATSIDSLIISINQPATVNAGNDGTICSSQTFTITGAAIGGSASNSTWTSNGSGTFDNSALLGATYSPSNADISAGSITLTLTTNDPTGVCGSVTDNLLLTISTTPPPPTVSNNTITACSGVSVAAIVATGTGGSITWFSDAGLTNIIGTGNSYVPGVLTSSTSYWVTETLGACQSIATQINITINPLPVADTTALVITPANCGATTGVIAGISMTSGQAPYTYVWQDPSLNIVGNSSTLTNVGAGLFTLTITDGNGCSSSVGPITVTSTMGVVSSFSATPVTGETPLSVDFTNTSTGATNYLWQFGTGATSSAVNPTYIYIPLGNYSVCLIADNGAGCIDTSCANIDVYINSSFVIPNVFTPNNDNVNDMFAVQNKGLKTMDAEIFNRWGEKMFEWHTTNGGWDGRTTSGILAPEGTYYYIIKATGIDGKEYFEKGGFTLMR